MLAAIESRHFLFSLSWEFNKLLWRQKHNGWGGQVKNEVGLLFAGFDKLDDFTVWTIGAAFLKPNIIKQKKKHPDSQKKENKSVKDVWE